MQEIYEGSFCEEGRKGEGRGLEEPSVCSALVREKEEGCRGRKETWGKCPGPLGSERKSGKAVGCPRITVGHQRTSGFQEQAIPYPCYAVSLAGSSLGRCGLGTAQPQISEQHLGLQGERWEEQFH